MKKNVWLFRPVILLLSALCVGLTAATFFINRTVFYVEAVVTVAALIFAIFQLGRTQRELRRFLTFLGEQLSTTQRRALTQFPLPVLVVDKDNEILWYNDIFRDRVIGGEEIFGESLSSIVGPVDFAAALSPAGSPAACGGKSFLVYAVESGAPGDMLFALYFIDKTEEIRLRNLYDETRPAVMTIVLDNIEDLFANVRESERSRIMGEVENLFEDFSTENNCLVKKVSNSRFIAVIEEKYLSRLVSGRFAILDKARAITTSDNLAVTLSIGVARGERSLDELEGISAQALEMCLGRGGDQAAVRDSSGYEFYGGFSKGIEKRTKVKTRIVAAALSDLIASSRNVFVMGHRFGDLDCAGAAIGMACAARHMDKQVGIVINRAASLAGPIIDKMEAGGFGGLYVTPEQALAMTERDTLLIIVDTHVRHILESKELYEACRNVVVIDHHRRMVGYIDNAVIFYHEPHASSASEMVTELLQYFDERCRPSKLEAEALLAGITLDTKSFSMRAGVRTFEAAAYLRKLGADTVEVRSLFADSMETYQHRAAVVSRADIYRGCAISFTESFPDIALVAPQAADELLTIQGVGASFVLFQTPEGVSCSARSLGGVNVQVILETLGGGGHQTMAGAQMEKVTPAAAHGALIKAIDDYFEHAAGHEQ